LHDVTLRKIFQQVWKLINWQDTGLEIFKVVDKDKEVGV
jgi:hypothetical protein